MKTYYRVRVAGADFEAADDGCEYNSNDAAKRAAVKAGVAIAADEVERGKASSIVEAHVLQDEQTIGRFIITLRVEAQPVQRT